MATQATQADRTKKSTKSRVGWFKDDVQVLLDWLSFRDTNGILRNAILYKKHAAGASKKIGKETEIAEKMPGTMDKVIERKLRSMKDTYLKMRNKAESTGWGVDFRVIVGWGVVLGRSTSGGGRYSAEKAPSEYAD